MPGIDGDNQDLFWNQFGGLRRCCRSRRCGRVATLDQREYWIDRYRRKNVDHQPMTVLADRLECKHFRGHLLSEFENDSGDAGFELTHTCAGQEGVVVRNL